MQTGTQNEVAIKQGTGLAKEGEEIVTHSMVGRFGEIPFSLASETDALQFVGGFENI
jgi:hypothetical protein